MILAFDRHADGGILLVKGLEVTVEQLVDFREHDLVLWAFRSGKRGHDRAHVERKRVGEDRLVLRREPHALFLGIGLDQRDALFRATGKAHVIERLVVDAEEAAGRTVFRRHIGDGCTVGEAEVGNARTVEFDKPPDHADFAQHLHAGQYEIGRGDAFGHCAGQLEANDFGDQHRNRLAEHGSLRLDSADAPAQNAKAVDHGGVAVGADTGVRVSDGRAVLIVRRPHALAEIFEVHLVADAGARWNGSEVLEALGTPFEEVVALRIAGIFELDVLFERLGVAEFVDHDRMVDHQVDRNLRVDLGGITTKLCDRIAHRGEIDHARHAGEILQQHARGAVLDFLAGGRVALPVGNRLRVFGRDGETAIFEAEHVLQQDLEAEGQFRNIADRRFGLGEGIIGVVLATYRKG